MIHALREEQAEVRRHKLTLERRRELAAKLRAFYAGDEKRWTQKALARTAEGKDCHPKDPAAACWCIHGAAIALGFTFIEMRELLGGSGVWAWNDQPWRPFFEVDEQLALWAGEPLP